MDKLRLNVQILFITIALVIGYELKIAISLETPVRILSIAVAGYVLSNIFAAYATRKLLSVRWVRKQALGRAWVEGNWYIKTYDPANSKPVAQGLLTLSYSDTDYSLIASSYKLSSPESGIATISRSKSVFLNSTDLSYVNCFVYTLGAQFIHGVAIGNFYHEEGGFPVRYDGKLYFFNEMPEYRQIAVKIPDEEIEDMRRKEGAEWRTGYLTQKRKTTNGNSSH